MTKCWLIWGDEYSIMITLPASMDKKLVEMQKVGST